MRAGFPDEAAVAVEQVLLAIEQEVFRGPEFPVGIVTEALVLLDARNAEPCRRRHEDGVGPAPSFQALCIVEFERDLWRVLQDIFQPLHGIATFLASVSG
jgi:hypothetical protein